MSKLIFDIETVGEDFDELEEVTQEDLKNGQKKFLEIAKYNASDLFATKSLYDYWQKYLSFY